MNHPGQQEQEEPTPQAKRPEVPHWLTPGVWGIGLASFLADVGHEVPTALFASLVTITLGAPAAALGLIEGLADGLAGLARFAGGALADDPHRRRNIALGGYSLTALLAALIGAASAVWQVALLRMAAWTSRGLRVPARNALLADMVPSEVYGRAYGFERMMDNLGAVGGPLLALGLVALVGIRWAIGLSVIPGLLAALSILYAIRHIPRVTTRARVPLKITVRPLLRGRLGQVLVGVSLFETANVATTLLILRATQLLVPSLGVTTATEVAIGLYAGYNAAATVASLPAGRMSDRWGPIGVLMGGVFFFLVAYLGFAVSVPSIGLLAASFVVAGLAIGRPAWVGVRSAGHGTERWQYRGQWHRRAPVDPGIADCCVCVPGDLGCCFGLGVASPSPESGDSWFQEGNRKPCRGNRSGMRAGTDRTRRCDSFLADEGQEGERHMVILSFALFPRLLSH